MARSSLRSLLVCAGLLLAAGLGGCSQQIAVEGRSDRLYAEAKGALLSEGFRPVGRSGAGVAAQGSDPRSGRLQFLYYADAVSPTVVEVQIAPSGRDGTEAGNGATPAQAAEVSPMLAGAHLVIVKAWSSMTFAPDPFIADLAMGVLRRAYSLSGNAP